MDKLGWITRLKLCWVVLTKGTYNPAEYRTKHAQKQWDICRERDRDMNAAVRPRVDDCPESEFGDQ